MSALGNKIRNVFGSASVYKDPDNNSLFAGRNLPSFIKDFLISMHADTEGNVQKEKLSRFLDQHIPANNNAVKARLMQGEVLTMLTRFIVSTSISKNKIGFQIPDMGIKANETNIPKYLLEKHPKDLIDGEHWGIIKVVYIAPEDERSSGGYIEMAGVKPFRPLEKMDLSVFRECRAQFSLDEWIDVLISAMEYTPESFSGKTQKLEFITRLLPFIEPRCNMIELAPKGTGKSYVFSKLSKYVWLVSGGKVSRAKLFYDKTRHLPGIMASYDLVAFDEISSISFSDVSEMQAILKAYLEDGKTTVDRKSVV